VQVKEHRADGDDSESFMAQVWNCQTKYELDDEDVAYVGQPMRLNSNVHLSARQQLGGSAFEAGYNKSLPLIKRAST
jgi:hypothetical protein